MEPSEQPISKETIDDLAATPLVVIARRIAQLKEEKEQQAQTIMDCQKKIAQLSCQLEDDLLKGDN